MTVPRVRTYFHADRDKNKKYTKEEEDDFDRQEREHNAGNTGSYAAYSGGAADLAHHEDPNTNKPLPVAPGNHGVGTGAGTQNALTDRTRDNEYSSTTGNDSIRDPLGEHLHGARNHGVGHDDYSNTSANKEASGFHPKHHPANDHETNTTGTQDYGRDVNAVGGAGSLGEDGHERNRLHKDAPSNY